MICADVFANAAKDLISPQELVASVQDFVDWLLGFPLQFAFPNLANSPPAPLQLGAHALIARDVRADFPPPEFLTGFWPLEQVASMAVPKATVDENQRLSGRKNHIWSAGQALVMKSISPTPSVKTSADYHLGLGVCGADRSHHSASHLWANDVRQLQSSSACLSLVQQTDPTVGRCSVPSIVQLPRQPERRLRFQIADTLVCQKPGSSSFVVRSRNP